MNIRTIFELTAGNDSNEPANMRSTVRSSIIAHTQIYDSRFSNCSIPAEWPSIYCENSSSQLWSHVKTEQSSHIEWGMLDINAKPISFDCLIDNSSFSSFFSFRNEDSRIGLSVVVLLPAAACWWSCRWANETIFIFCHINRWFYFFLKNAHTVHT